MLPNIHQRKFRAPPEAVGSLVDRVSGRDDPLWPVDRWPGMRLSGPLGVGVSGGHGGIRYAVEEYVPGRRIVFRFAERGGLSEGLVGRHRLEVESTDDGGSVLRHVIDARCRDLMRLKWPLVIEPLHDALIEDALDRAARALGETPNDRPHSRWVRCLRGVLRRVRRSA